MLQFQYHTDIARPFTISALAVKSVASYVQKHTRSETKVPEKSIIKVK